MCAFLTSKLYLKGTTLKYVPGLLVGGKIEHDCKLTRGIGYYFEFIVCLAPFMKQPLEITLRGVTNDPNDITVRTLISIG